jgi:hypothetical protein
LEYGGWRRRICNGYFRNVWFGHGSSLSLRLPILQLPQRVPCIAKRTEVRDGFLGAGFPCSMVKDRLMSGARRPWNCHAPVDENRTAVTYCSGSPNLGLATSHKSRCNHLRQIASSKEDLSTGSVIIFSRVNPQSRRVKGNSCVFSKKTT